VPPQQSLNRSTAATSFDAASVSAASTPVYDFDPAAATLAAGQMVTVSVRATGDILPPSALAIVFDPAVIAVIGAQPIVEDGTADTSIEPGRVVLELPGGTVLSGTQVIARLTLVGVKAGRSALSFEQAPGSSSSATVEVK
jgi:hypothetical protein